MRPIPYSVKLQNKYYLRVIQFIKLNLQNINKIIFIMTM